MSKKLQKMLALREKMLSECKLCNGTGILNNNECDCLKLHEKYVDYYYAGVSEEYWELTFSDWEGDKLAQDLVKQYINNLEIANREGLGAIFYGSNGTGKSFSSILILKACYDKKYSIKFITFDELLDWIKSSYQLHGFEKEEFDIQFSEQILDVDFLVIDNLCSELVSSSNRGYPISQLDKILRYRRRNCLSTILTTNLNPQEFSEKYGSSVMSLLNSKCKSIQVVGVDFRKKQNSEWDQFILGKEY